MSTMVTERIKPGIVVRYGDRVGVTVSDGPGMMSCCGDWETPVVFGGETYSSGTPTDELKIVGPDESVADFKKCGAGSERCCIFLTGGPTGACCERYSGLRTTLIFRTMNAKRHPTKMFPACQNLEDGNP